MTRFRKKERILPGFSITLGFTILYLSLIVLIPLAALAIKSADLSAAQWWKTVSDPRVVASYRLSLTTAFVAAAVNFVFGLLLAWVLVRYEFPGKRIIDGLIDLPFALPTAVAGIALTTIYAPKGWVGSLLEPLGIKVAYTPIGITIALIFIGIPFVVRTVQPVLQDLESDMEEAAVMLGSYRLRIFFKIILPDLIPPLLTGFALAFARGIGEYGSVVFISGNMPMKTEIAPLLIITKLEQYQYAQAAAVAVVLLLISFALLLVINILQRWSNRRLRTVKGA
ncbi:sulfate ABC transporter permease subunit CysT [Cohnella sp. CIP 111063]|uniref:sulfate ABC transporter permease subunit CysT n=1 Tax=unclassified Cohnella TaxID=2636738 RepID=UPI000B8C697D|nr:MULTISPECIES: sulfate ABC transporter permease subunit CysT [unclassified Cohnella]OXS52203.1 sulfate ABC transporter permease subunit CysT [Cohnella sp. CIP 111063]PRX55534.1 sulfate transport system permease protein [Cohnella sp. SGD-V74]